MVSRSVWVGDDYLDAKNAHVYFFKVVHQFFYVIVRHRAVFVGVIIIGHVVISIIIGLGGAVVVVVVVHLVHVETTVVIIIVAGHGIR